MAPSITKTEKEILRTLAELGGKQIDDDSIVFEGTDFRLPKAMEGNLDRAIKFLDQKRNEWDADTNFVRTFNYRPWDGAYCMWNAFKRTFGAVGHKGSPGFFGLEPPRMISIPSGVDETTQVPWGVFNLPGLKNVRFETFEFQHDELGPLFGLSVIGPKKYAAQIEGVFKLVENELETNSMYRGKAFDGQGMPEFIDLSGVDREGVVYSSDVLTQLEVNIWAQLRHTAEFEKHGVPLKRAVLVHGPYGTGKTLAAVLTGQEAVANGWTFIKGRPGRDNLGFVMQTARLYQPSVVFYEDVDQVADVEALDGSGISRLLDDFDGIEAKNTKILCVLTTNHPDRIHKAMARPGRLDAMIQINELDQAGMQKLVEVCVGRDLLADNIDWDAVYEAANGYMPAFVTEFATRATRYAIVRKAREIGLHDEDDWPVDLEPEEIVTADLVSAARGLRPQFELMGDAKDKHERPRLEVALQDTIVTAVRESVHEEYLAPTNGTT